MVVAHGALSTSNPIVVAGRIEHGAAVVVEQIADLFDTLIVAVDHASDAIYVHGERGLHSIHLGNQGAIGGIVALLATGGVAQRDEREARILRRRRCDRSAARGAEKAQTESCNTMYDGLPAIWLMTLLLSARAAAADPLRHFDAPHAQLQSMVLCAPAGKRMVVLEAIGGAPHTGFDARLAESLLSLRRGARDPAADTRKSAPVSP